MRRAVLPCLLAAVIPTLTAAAAPEQPARVLPLKTLRLYETGVGYFERTGRLDGTATLPVPAAHVDDLLMTLVVSGGGQVEGVEFPSVVSPTLGRALAGLPEDPDGAFSFADVLTSLKGTPVRVRLERRREVQAGTAERPPRFAVEKETLAGTVAEVSPADAAGAREVLLVTDRGDVRRLAAQEIVSVAPTDPALAARFAGAVDALSPRAAQIRRRLRVRARGGRPLTLGYVAETPVWRTTWRLVLDGDDGALQGWALVHNDTDEAWRGVRLELVSGRPDSFLFPLAAPRYLRRPVVQPAEVLSTVPQLAARTPDALFGDGAISEVAGYGGLGTVGYGGGSGGLGAGVTGGIGVRGEAASPRLRIGDLSAFDTAEGEASGALFAYRIARHLDLEAHGSALVPFLQRPVPTDRYTTFDAPGESGRSTVRLSNDTGQTLPAGTLAVFRDGRFAGEADLPRLDPDATALVRYGRDLEVALSLARSEAAERPRLFAWERGALVVDLVRHTELGWQVRDRSRRGRALLVGLDVVRNARVEGAEVVWDAVAGRPYARVPARRGERTVTVGVDEGLARRLPPAKLASETLRAWSKAEAVPASQRTILARAATHLAEAESRWARRSDLVAEKGRLGAELDRLRGHLSALGGGGGAADAAGPLVTRILAREDRLLAVEDALRSLEATHAQDLEALGAILEELGPPASP